MIGILEVISLSDKYVTKKHKSQRLHQGIIDEVCRQLSDEDKSYITDSYWEYIPDENLSLNEQIGYIVSAIYNDETYSTMLVLAQLMMPVRIRQKGDKFSKPIIADYLMRNKNTAELHNAIDLYREHKHCPMKYKNNDKFMLILLIDAAIDVYITTLVELHKIEYDNLYDAIIYYANIMYRDQGVE